MEKIKPKLWSELLNPGVAKENLNPISQSTTSMNNSKMESTDNIQKFIGDIWPQLSDYSAKLNGNKIKISKLPLVQLRNMTEKEIRAAKTSLKTLKTNSDCYILSDEELPDLELLTSYGKIRKVIIKKEDNVIDTDVLQKITNIKEHNTSIGIMDGKNKSELSKISLTAKKEEVKQAVSDMRNKWINSPLMNNLSPKHSLKDGPSSSKHTDIPFFKNKPNPFLTNSNFENKEYSANNFSLKRKLFGDEEFNNKKSKCSPKIETLFEDSKKIYKNRLANLNKNNDKTVRKIDKDIVKEYNKDKSSTHSELSAQFPSVISRIKDSKNTSDTTDTSVKDSKTPLDTTETSVRQMVSSKCSQTLVTFKSCTTEKPSQTLVSYNSSTDKLSQTLVSYKSSTEKASQTLVTWKRPTDKSSQTDNCNSLDNSSQTDNVVNIEKLTVNNSTSTTATVIGENYYLNALDVVANEDDKLMSSLSQLKNPLHNLFNTMKIVKGLTEKFKKFKNNLEIERDNVMKNVQSIYGERLSEIGKEIEKQESLFFFIMNEASENTKSDDESNVVLKNEIDDVLNVYLEASKKGKEKPTNSHINEPIEIKIGPNGKKDFEDKRKSDKDSKSLEVNMSIKKSKSIEDSLSNEKSKSDNKSKPDEKIKSNKRTKSAEDSSNKDRVLCREMVKNIASNVIEKPKRIAIISEASMLNFGKSNNEEDTTNDKNLSTIEKAPAAKESCETVTSNIISASDENVTLSGILNSKNSGKHSQLNNLTSLYTNKKKSSKNENSPSTHILQTALNNANMRMTSTNLPTENNNNSTCNMNFGISTSMMNSEQITSNLNQQHVHRGMPQIVPEQPRRNVPSFPSGISLNQQQPMPQNQNDYMQQCQQSLTPHTNQRLIQTNKIIPIPPNQINPMQNIQQRSMHPIQQRPLQNYQINPIQNQQGSVDSNQQSPMLINQRRPFIHYKPRPNLINQQRPTKLGQQRLMPKLTPRPQNYNHITTPQCHPNTSNSNLVTNEQNIAAQFNVSSNNSAPICTPLAPTGSNPRNSNIQNYAEPANKLESVFSSQVDNQHVRLENNYSGASNCQYFPSYQNNSQQIAQLTHNNQFCQPLNNQQFTYGIANNQQGAPLMAQQNTDNTSQPITRVTYSSDFSQTSQQFINERNNNSNRISQINNANSIVSNVDPSRNVINNSQFIAPVTSSSQFSDASIHPVSFAPNNQQILLPQTTLYKPVAPSVQDNILSINESEESTEGPNLTIQSVVGGVNEEIFTQNKGLSSSSVIQLPTYAETLTNNRLLKLPQVIASADNLHKNNQGQHDNASTSSNTSSFTGQNIRISHVETVGSLNNQNESNVIQLGDSPEPDILPACCFLCGMDAELTCCGKFKYCGVECQNDDAERHKNECVAIK